jgi:hypothetical protein
MYIAAWHTNQGIIVTNEGDPIAKECPWDTCILSESVLQRLSLEKLHWRSQLVGGDFRPPDGSPRPHKIFRPAHLSPVLVLCVRKHGSLVLEGYSSQGKAFIGSLYKLMGINTHLCIDQARYTSVDRAPPRGYSPVTKEYVLWGGESKRRRGHEMWMSPWK